MTVSAFADWWKLNVLPREGLAPKTVRWYVDTLDSYVLPFVGQRSLSGRRALTVADVERLTGTLAQKGLSHRVQVAARTTLGKVLRSAERDGLVARNVAYLSRPPRDGGRARDIKALTSDEVRNLLLGLYGTRWYPLTVVAVTTGLRPAELLALHWADVRIEGDHPQLSVRHAISHVEGPALKAPKRARSYRTVPLTAEAVSRLRLWRKVQLEDQLAAGSLWRPTWPDLVFTSATGGALRVDSFRHALSKCQPGTYPHRLRHTYATHLIEAGVPIAHVAELLGDTVAVVESTYSHVLRPKYEVAALVSSLLA